MLMGGRIAEEITTVGITTGAGNDLERATELARRMVCEWGMSEAMGPLTFGKKAAPIFLGRDFAQHQDYSEHTALRIDQEIKRIVSANYERAHRILVEYKAVLMNIADELLTREVLDGEQVRRMVRGLSLDEPQPAVSTGPAAAVPDDEDTRRRQQKRPSLVPPLTRSSPASIAASCFRSDLTTSRCLAVVCSSGIAPDGVCRPLSVRTVWEFSN